MSLLIDIGTLDIPSSNQALEAIYKAASQPPEDGLWYPHESPFVRRIIELFSERGLLKMAGVQEELHAWLDGKMFIGGAQTVRPHVGQMERWGAHEIALVKLYLGALPVDVYTLEDWLLLVDWIVQRYLPADAAKTEAEWFAVRAALAGKIQSKVDARNEEVINPLLAALPNTVAAADEAFKLAPVQRAALEYGYAHCAENITALTDSLRHKLRGAIMDYTQAQMMGDESARASLDSRLLDEFATMNRDWRRIALTEAGEIANQGFIASMKPGSKVKRVEFYRGACGYCRSIDGLVMTVVDPAARYKDGQTQIWPGKTNLGRSVAPRKRVGDVLVPREAHEMFWPAAGVQHPNCRGFWEPVEDAGEPGDDPAFASWLDNLLKPKK